MSDSSKSLQPASSMLERVLVIDPDEHIQQLLRDYLKEIFPESDFVAVSSFENARNELEHNRIDFIICELELIDSSGINTLLGISSVSGTIPILVHAAKEDYTLAIQAIQCGAEDYLVKGRGTALTFKRIMQHSSERRRIREELKQANDTLEQKVAERTQELATTMHMLQEANRAKEEFFANMTHELRTPLHAIINFSKFGIRKANSAEPDKLMEYFSDIHRSGQRLLGLVNDILDLTKHQAGKSEMDIQQENINDMVQDVSREMASILETKQLTLEVDIDATCELALMDRRRIHQVLVNLIGNAAKFSYENRPIQLVVEPAENIQRFARQPNNHNRPMAAFSVIDRGEGIPTEELGTVFDEFAQSSKIKSGSFHGGTGLGLSICRQIIQAHFGSIWAETNPQGGAIVRFVLPIADK